MQLKIQPETNIKLINYCSTQQQDIWELIAFQEQKLYTHTSLHSHIFNLLLKSNLFSETNYPFGLEMGYNKNTVHIQNQ